MRSKASRARKEAHPGARPVDLYPSSDSFRKSLLALAKRDCNSDSSLSTDERVKRFVFDRFLARLNAYDPDRWLLKGGVALAARYVNTRYTKDIDLSDRDVMLKSSIEHLRYAVERDLGDFLEFTVVDPEGWGQLLASGLVNRRGAKLSIKAQMAGDTLYEFHVDLAVGATITTHTDRVPSLEHVDVPGITPGLFAAMPIADVLADKIRATFEVDSNGDGSVRYRDLVDLVVTLNQSYVSRSQLKKALEVNFSNHGIELPKEFKVPYPDRWRDGYERIINQYKMTDLPNFEDAILLVNSAFQGAFDTRLNARAATWKAGEGWNDHCITRIQLDEGLPARISTPRKGESNLSL